MSLFELFAQHDLSVLIIMAIASLFAGFIDAIVGGGGLIQFPSFMILFPNSSIPTAFGTNKIAGLSGTSIAAVQYAKRVKFNWKLLFITAFSSFIFSFIGQFHCFFTRRFIHYQKLWRNWFRTFDNQ